MMKTLRYILYIPKVLALWVLGLGYFIVAALIRIIDPWTAISVFQHYLRLCMRVFGLKVRFEFKQEGTRNARNSVFVLLNQSSFLDSMVTPILPVPRTRGILNIEMAFYPIIGWFLAMANFVIIRQWKEQSKRTLNRTGDHLRSGGNMLISIEGKRSRDGKLNTYKKGPVVMAIKNGSDLVPMIIEGTYRSLPYGSLYPEPGEVIVRILDPISTKDLTYADRDPMVDRLHSIALEHGLR